MRIAILSTVILLLVGCAPSVVGNWEADEASGPNGERSILEIDKDMTGEAVLYVWTTVDDMPFPMELFYDIEVDGSKDEWDIELEHIDLCVPIDGIDDCMGADSSLDGDAECTVDDGSEMDCEFGGALDGLEFTFERTD